MESKKKLHFISKNEIGVYKRVTAKVYNNCKKVSPIDLELVRSRINIKINIKRLTTFHSLQQFF